MFWQCLNMSSIQHSASPDACLFIAATKLSSVRKGALISRMPSFSISRRCFSNLSSNARNSHCSNHNQCLQPEHCRHVSVSTTLACRIPDRHTTHLLHMFYCKTLWDLREIVRSQDGSIEPALCQGVAKMHTEELQIVFISS